jgi:hypothetical protein
MKKKVIFLSLILGLSSFGILAPPRVESRDETVIAFVNVNLIPMDRERVLPNQLRAGDSSHS